MSITSENNVVLTPLALRPAAAAKMISVSVVSLWRYEQAGMIKAVPGTGLRYGRAKLFSIEELKRFVSGEHTRTASGSTA